MDKSLTLGGAIALQAWTDVWPSAPGESIVDQWIEVRVGRGTLALRVTRYKEPIAETECRAVLDTSRSTRQALDLTFFRRWQVFAQAGKYPRGQTLHLAPQD
jgi:hypothetical protein